MAYRPSSAVYMPKSAVRIDQPQAGGGSFMDKLLAPAREFGREKIQPLLDRPLSKPAAKVSRGLKSATESVARSPAYRETAGAFMKGALAGDVGAKKVPFLPPETGAGKAIQTVGFAAGMFNPKSVINRLLGVGLGAGARAAKGVAKKVVGGLGVEVGQRVAAETLRLSPSQVAKTITKEGQSSLLKEAAERGIPSFTPKKLVEHANKLKSQIWPEVKETIRKNRAKLPKLDFTEILSSLDDEYKLLISSGGEKSAANTIKSIQNELLTKYGDKISWKQLFKLKTNWNQLASRTYKSGARAVVSEVAATKQLTHRILADTSRLILNEAADKAGIEGFAKLVSDYGFWETMLSYAKQSRGRQLSGGLGVRGLITGIPGKIAASPYTISSLLKGKGAVSKVGAPLTEGILKQLGVGMAAPQGQ